MNGENGTMATAKASFNGRGDFVAKQKTRLEEEKKTLFEAREDLTNPKKVAFNFEGDPCWEAKIRRLGERIKAVDIALARVQNGSYLICTKCGEEIETKRLEACPATHICTSCMPPEPIKKRHAF